LFETHHVSAGQAIVISHREESTEAIKAKESNLVVAPNELTRQEAGVMAQHQEVPTNKSFVPRRQVMTLCDLHVGLPRGSFGFLFWGQR
jgi:hypothetical protein